MAQSSNAVAASAAGSASSPSSVSACCSCIGALIVYRIGSFIPVPGVNPEAMLAAHGPQQGTIVDMFNMFSGGALERFSLFALNVMPYISASIIVQLMAQIMPSLKAHARRKASRAGAS